MIVHNSTQDTNDHDVVWVIRKVMWNDTIHNPNQFCKWLKDYKSKQRRLLCSPVWHMSCDWHSTRSSRQLYIMTNSHAPLNWFVLTWKSRKIVLVVPSLPDKSEVRLSWNPNIVLLSGNFHGRWRTWRLRDQLLFLPLCFFFMNSFERVISLGPLVD